MISIGEPSSQTGLPASTIRYWERMGVLPTPARASGQRRYSEEAVHRISVSRLAQACGFTLQEMRHLLHGFEARPSSSLRWRQLARKKQQELLERMDQLKAMKDLVAKMASCQCADLRERGRNARLLMPANESFVLMAHRR